MGPSKIGFPKGQYAVIVADPPWPYQQILGRGKRNEDTTRGGLPYTPMGIDEIATVPVASIAGPDSMLWLWTTNSHIHEALHVMEAWGFLYKTMATWPKTQFGLGYWLRGQTEHCLLGVKGNPRKRMIGPHGATGTAWSTLLPVSKRLAHSQKPGALMDMAEEMGEEPRIELFARSQRLGWESWGLEIPVAIQRKG